MNKNKMLYEDLLNNSLVLGQQLARLDDIINTAAKKDGDLMVLIDARIRRHHAELKKSFDQLEEMVKRGYA